MRCVVFSALRRAFVPGLIPEDFETRTRFVEQFEQVALPPELAPFSSAWALPNSNGDVLLVPLPGHAAGHLGAFVRTQEGWVLLAADAAWSPLSYRELRGRRCSRIRSWKTATPTSTRCASCTRSMRRPCAHPAHTRGGVVTALHRLLWSYWQTRRLRLADRAALEAHQQRQIKRFTQRVLTRSPYFRTFASKPMHEWPLMDKATMMANFDAMNTAGLRLADVLACAQQAEQSRDFRPTVGAYSVGLSSGTSGGRGVFVVSPTERAQWAGILLAKLLPRGLLHGERVALFLRANSNLYTAVRNPRLTFSFFDLFAPFESHRVPLEALQPTIIVGPAQVLRALAMEKLAGRLDIAPVQVLSGAEVLEPMDRALLAQAFGNVARSIRPPKGSWAQPARTARCT